YGILVDSVGEKLGLRTGDKILAVDGKKTKKFSEAKIEILLGDEVTVDRGGEILTIPIPDEGKKEVLQTLGREPIQYLRKAVLEEVIEESVAEEAGFMPGDEFVMVN